MAAGGSDSKVTVLQTAGNLYNLCTVTKMFRPFQRKLFNEMLMSRLKVYIQVLFFLLFCSLPAEAAIITLLNGDQLSGEIKNESEQSLTLHHAVLGDIVIPRKEIAEIPNKGDGKHSNDIIIQDKTAAAGKTTKTTAAEKTTNTTETAKAEPKAKAADLVDKPARSSSSSRLPGLFGTGFFEGWKHRLAFGIKGEEGNDVSMDFSAVFNTSYKNDTDRFSLESAYYYETDDREKDTSKGHINVVRDWLLPHSNWFVYGYGRYEYDSFKSWKHRVSLSSGPGYDFYREDDFTLTGRIGLGVSKTWGTEDDLDLEGQLGIECSWKPASLKNQVLSYQVIFYPIINNFGEYRTWMEGKWHFGIGLYRGLGFEIGFEHEYETDGERDIENEKSYDLLYFGRLGLDF